MPANLTGRLVILSGPSCVGKSPLRTALAKSYPQVWSRVQKLVLFNSRTPRTGRYRLPLPTPEPGRGLAFNGPPCGAGGAGRPPRRGH